MKMRHSVTILLMLFFLAPALAAQNAEMLFKKLFEKDGLVVKFIFYRTGNGVDDNGINILLKNKNDYKISYKFTLIFRAGNLEKYVKVNGTMKSKELKTGSNSNLYYIPFGEGKSITEVGITKIRINE